MKLIDWGFIQNAIENKLLFITNMKLISSVWVY